jgi:branched-chain amino acid transport system permease protein
MLGGAGTMLGPVVGAALVVGIENYFADLGAWVTMIQGAIFVFVVMVFRRGIVGELAPLLRRCDGGWRRAASRMPALPSSAAGPNPDRGSSGASPLAAAGSLKPTDGTT